MKAGQQHRLESVDVLRAIAALYVVLVHVRHMPQVPNAMTTLLFAPVNMGYLGVMLFLVISGFCIHLGTAKQIARTGQVRSNWRNFWWRRFHRLYPTYVAAMVFGLIVFNGRYDLYAGRPIQMQWDLLTHLLMVHNLFPAYNAGLGNGIFWSLGLEEQLYALYAVYLISRRRAPSIRTTAAILGLTILWRAIAVYFEGTLIGVEPFQLGGWYTFWPFATWGYWILGALAAEAYAGAIVLPSWCYRYAAAMQLMIFGVLTNRETLGYLIRSHFLALHADSALLRATLTAIMTLSDTAFSLAFFIILNRWVTLEAKQEFRFRGSRALAAVGLFSYSLYLVHMPVLYWFDTNFPIRFTALRYAAMLPITVGFAFLFFHAVEKHFLNKPQSEAPNTASATASLVTGLIR